MTGPLRPLRCTVITPYGALGGSERWLLELLDAGAARLDVVVWLLQDGPLRAELAARGASVQVLPTGPGGRSVATRARDLARRLRRSDTDVVLANGVKAALVAVPSARLAGVPVAWAKHDFSWDRELARPLGALSDLVVATSAAVGAATGRRDALLVPPPRPAGTPASAIDARTFWAAQGVRLGTAPTLAMVSRLVPYKGIDTAIRALACDLASRWQLVVVGPADPSAAGEETRLRSLALDLAVADRVSFVGEVGQVGRWLTGFDAVAVLTRADGTRFGREGYSIVALEALAAGVPLVGARGSPEVERMASSAGRVVEPEDPGSVARALHDLRRPDVRARCGAAAREIIVRHPDGQACAGQVIGALATVAGRPGAGLSGPPVTVLTCFRDEVGHIDDVVAAVLRQLGPHDEYLLLDDRSTDDTAAELGRWAARDPRLRLISGPGINLSAARNLGFSEATRPVVVCTDAGCAPAPDWLAALRAPYAEAAPAELVVGVYDVDGGDPVREACRLALFPSVDEARRRTPWVRLAGRLTGRRFDAHRLDGRSMACTVRAWELAGGFDVALGSSEDAVFGEAVLAAGAGSVLALDARVTWAQADRLGDTARMYLKYGEWGARAGSWPLVRRDLARAGGYLLAPVLLARGGTRTRVAVIGAAAGYLGVPVSRALRGRSAPTTLALVPAVLAVKDLAKAVGCVKGGIARLARPGERSRDGG
ncbi:glycosyltransferase [Nocardioides donggukensis]|uniref:Glycosyltransferase n=1 Tax=Nocardioides donggukensis TaxID=2774019 RepID=A0A927K349_9ACTN|nr:glycosyltransferase [Nocardioides donggukensis]MBD8869499.1 glycosyltransferase [Nocardioides donggukensis]